MRHVAELNADHALHMRWCLAELAHSMCDGANEHMRLVLSVFVGS